MLCFPRSCSIWRCSSASRSCRRGVVDLDHGGAEVGQELRPEGTGHREPESSTTTPSSGDPIGRVVPRAAATGGRHRPLRPSPRPCARRAARHRRWAAPASSRIGRCGRPCGCRRPRPRCRPRPAAGRAAPPRASARCTGTPTAAATFAQSPAGNFATASAICSCRAWMTIMSSTEGEMRMEASGWRHQVGSRLEAVELAGVEDERRERYPVVRPLPVGAPEEALRCAGRRSTS